LLEVILLLLLCSRPERKRSSRSRRFHPEKCWTCKRCLHCARDNDLCTAAAVIHDHYGGGRDETCEIHTSRRTCALARSQDACSRLIKKPSLHMRNNSQSQRLLSRSHAFLSRTWMAIVFSSKDMTTRLRNTSFREAPKHTRMFVFRAASMCLDTESHTTGFQVVQADFQALTRPTH